MRKGWLFAAVLSGAAGTSSQAADVQIFGINTTSGTWAVYGRISNPNSTTAGQLVSGFSSIEVDVFNDQGASAPTVLTSVNKLPQGTTPFTDPVFQTQANPTGAVGYGFWLVRSDGTVGPEPVGSGAVATGRTGAFGISGGQYTFGSTTVPYRQLVIPGVGLTPGTVTPDANHTSTVTWGTPVMIASGTYTPGTDTTQGLKIELAPGTFVNLIRDTNPTWTRETAESSTVIDARNFTLGQSNQGISTVKAGMGDADLDGQVGFSDLVRVAQNYGGTGKTWFDGDFNFDGTVGFADLVAVAQHYGGPAPASSEFSSSFDQDMARAFASVPEPGSLGILIAGWVGLWMRPRKRKSS